MPENVTESEWLYQPFASGPRLAVAVVAGAVASYLNDRLAPLTFPALSVQEPLTVTLAVSGPA